MYSGAIGNNTGRDYGPRSSHLDAPMPNKFPKSLKILIGLAILFTVALIGSCSTVKRVTIDNGTEGIQVDKPYFFGTGGVRPDTLKPGAYFRWRSTEVIPVDVTPKTINIGFNDFSTSDNIMLDFESSVQYKIVNPASVYSKFGPNWFANNIQSQYTSIVREQVKQHDMTAIMSKPADAQAIDDAVTKGIRDLVAAEGIDVVIQSVSLGRAKPNEDVLVQMNHTAAEQQRLKTLEQSRLAEVKRKEEQEAKAIADDAYRAKMGWTTEQYWTKQIAELQAGACIKASACYMVPPGSAVVAK